MTKFCKRRNTCRLCDSPKLELVVPITATPMADGYVPKEQLNEKQECYPLDMYMCLACGHVQLRDVVDPSVLFGHYSYFSGRSGGLVKHFEEYAASVIAKNDLGEGAFVIDVGSNDGAFLRFFQDRGMRVLGIDPAENVARFANEQGIETLPEFLTMELAEKIRRERGAAQVVAANNVFAHTDDMGGMADSMRRLMADDGVFVFEVSYLVDVVDKMLLGTIFHEHLCYHTVKPLEVFLRRHDMELIDVERVTIQGGSLICTAQCLGGKRKAGASVAELKAMEKERGFDKPETLKAFSARLDKVKGDVTGLLKGLKGQGKSIAGFGAARGGTLLIYHFELCDILEYIVDDSPDKQGLYSPGCHIPVFATSALYERKPDYVFVLAWVHSKPIIRNHRKYLDAGGQFITCYPEIMTVTKDDNPFA
ncbi:MAG: methyltransferase domain-containing protein, partial [Kiritimatiellae bacterium]|nr:methyltransferase domain-containing protein [Kiritimatiellia bacterium]